MAQNKRQERLQARRQKERRGQLRNMALIGVVAVALVGWIAWVNFRPIPPRSHPMENGTRLGDPNAPVVLEEFGDFQCGHCQSFFLETSEQIIEQYVETGDVYYVFHAVPFLGPNSQIAAEASYCAADQGRFWDFHDNLFINFAQNLTEPGMVSRARSLDLDTDTFEECLSSDQKTDLILENLDYASSLGVGGTPAFVINGQLAIEGAQPFSVFQQTIESLLASSN